MPGMNKKAAVLVVDDEFGVRESFKMVLKDTYSVLLAATGKEAIELLTNNPVDLILLDILLPDIDGLNLLEKLKTIDPNTEIVMVTAVREIQSAVKAIKLGAYEYIIKPFVVEEVVNIINRALEKRSLVKELTYLRDELQRVQPFEKIIGEDGKMKEIFDLTSTISCSDGPPWWYPRSPPARHCCIWSNRGRCWTSRSRCGYLRRPAPSTTVCRMRARP